MGNSQDTNKQQQEPVTVLPDGSAFAVMSYPLPKDHWLYADRQYNEGEYEPVELGKPVLTHELRNAVVSAVRYAIRGATNCGKEVDFDPDALVQNAVYALCGPFTSPQPAQHSASVLEQNTSNSLETTNQEAQDEPVAWMEMVVGNLVREGVNKHKARELAQHFYTSPPASKPWVGLTDKEKKEIYRLSVYVEGAISLTEAKLREKNA